MHAPGSPRPPDPPKALTRGASTVSSRSLYNNVAPHTPAQRCYACSACPCSCTALLAGLGGLVLRVTRCGAHAPPRLVRSASSAKPSLRELCLSLSPFLRPLLVYRNYLLILLVCSLAAVTANTLSVSPQCHSQRESRWLFAEKLNNNDRTGRSSRSTSG